MNFENIFQNLFQSIKTTDKNHNNQNCLSHTPTYPIYPKPFQALGKTSACEIHPTTESKVLAPVHMRQWVQRLSDLPQVRSGRARTSCKSTPPQIQCSFTQQSHGIHRIFFWRAWGQPCASRQVSVLTPLYFWHHSLCTPVPGNQQFWGRLLTLKDSCTHSHSAHRVPEAATTTGMLAQSPPPSQGTYTMGTHKSKNGKKKNNKCDLGGTFLCPDFLRVWSGSQEVLD